MGLGKYEVKLMLDIMGKETIANYLLWKYKPQTILELLELDIQEMKKYIDKVEKKIEND